MKSWGRGRPCKKRLPESCLSRSQRQTSASQEGTLSSAGAGGGRALRRDLGAGARPLATATWGFHSRGNTRW